MCACMCVLCVRDINIQRCRHVLQHTHIHEGLSIPRSSVRFRLKPDNSNSHEFEHHRPSNKGTKLLLKVIKAMIIIVTMRPHILGPS